MANETNNDLSAATSNLVNTVGTLFQQSVAVWSAAFQATIQVFEPVGKSALDLVGSATNTLGQAVQNVTSTLAPKK
ncbi:MAG: chlorosome envelope protein B [Chlorobium sp.]|jgi:chlorosome envelope protein B|nr:MAG: chlorosome envelope protein B [Chlorobium sp.]